METYIILANYTQKGAANIKESPARIQAVRKAVEAAGGKWGGWYLTMGQYDIVLIVQAPNAQVAASLLLAIGSQGNVSTQSLRAFTEEEFKGLVASVP
ncbi:MAG: GYD family protein [Chloroflexi bacterium RBG_13_50_21]|nr:MAG: GYD family protein [Chloroflexi bacterium RBG_13_50_21]